MSSNSLVSIAEARGALRFNDTDSDVRLSLLISAASNAILRYINSEGDEYRDSAGDIIPGNVPDDIKIATIMLVGIMDRNPDGNDGGIYKSDFLPEPVEAILMCLRDPTLA
jgi:hypothetical protein